MPKSALQFINDAAAGRPIFLLVFNALCSDDADAEVQKVVDTSGYDLSAEGLAAAFAAATSGPHAISLFGGKYVFAEPADLKGQALMVNATTGCVVLLNEPVRAKAEAEAATFSWTLHKRKEDYKVTFDVGFAIDALPADHSCEGAREPGAAKVHAFQKLPPKPVDPLPDPEDTGSSNTLAIVFSLLGIGGALGLAAALYSQRKRLARFADHIQIQRRTRQMAHEIMLEEMRHPRLAPDYPNARPNVDHAIARELNDWLRQHPGVTAADLATDAYASQMAEIRAAANARARTTLRRDIEAHLDAAADRTYRGCTELAGEVYNDTVEPIVQSVSQHEMATRAPALADYTDAHLSALTQDSIARDAYYAGTQYKDAAAKDNQAAEAARASRQAKERARQDVQEQLRRTDLSTERRAALERDRAVLEREIDSLKRTEAEAEERRRANNDRAQDEAEAERRAREKSGRERRRADDRARKAFEK